MKKVRLAALALAVSCALSIGPAYATKQATDQSDLWWNPNESGWGVQLVHRGGFIFATMFVYDAAGKPTWYTGQLNDPGSTDDLVWAGDVYATTGPYFGAPVFDASTVTVKKVGTMQWSPTDVQTGTLTYTIDNVTTTKELTRQYLGFEDLSGDYMGAVHANTTGCTVAAANGDAFAFANLKAVQSGADLTLTLSPLGAPVLHIHRYEHAVRAVPVGQGNVQLHVGRHRQHGGLRGAGGRERDVRALHGQECGHRLPRQRRVLRSVGEVSRRRHRGRDRRRTARLSPR